MSVHRAPNGDYIGLRCDTCEKPAPSSEDLLRNHGMTQMGWFCSGGVHICPDCPQPEKVARAPANV